MQHLPASGSGDYTPMSYVPFLKCLLLSMQCWGHGQGLGWGQVVPPLLPAISTSLVSEDSSLVCWKVSSFSPLPLCHPPLTYMALPGAALMLAGDGCRGHAQIRSRGSRHGETKQLNPGPPGPGLTLAKMCELSPARPGACPDQAAPPDPELHQLSDLAPS